MTAIALIILYVFIGAIMAFTVMIIDYKFDLGLDDSPLIALAWLLWPIVAPFAALALTYTVLDRTAKRIAKKKR